MTFDKDVKHGRSTSPFNDKKMWVNSKSVVENKLLFLYGAEPVLFKRLR